MNEHLHKIGKSESYKEINYQTKYEENLEKCFTRESTTTNLENASTNSYWRDI